jgi:septal ring factor EnvC (AmiA/AmiB activator)
MKIEPPRFFLTGAFLARAWLVLLLVLSVDLALAQDPPSKQLKEIEREIERSKKESKALDRQAMEQAEALQRLRQEMVSAAHSAQEGEEKLTRLERKIASLKTEDAAKTSALFRRSNQMVDVLAALERLAWRPTEAVIASPGAPSDTIRSALLLRAAVPAIDREAKTLRRELETLSTIRGEILRERKEISGTVAKLSDDRKRVSTMLKRQSELQERTEAQKREAEARVAKLAHDAEDLRDLMAKLEDERKQRLAEDERRRKQELAAKAAAAQAAREAAKETNLAAKTPLPPSPPPPPERPAFEKAKLSEGEAGSFSAAKGRMPFPARGSLIQRYGEPNAHGQTSKGLSIAARAGAQVIAPHEGHVVFAGPFRGYGLLLIIEHSEGYHTLLSGMARIDAAVGRTVVAGEPVGVMGEGNEASHLYVELRRNGHPVNPLPFLEARQG